MSHLQSPGNLGCNCHHREFTEGQSGQRIDMARRTSIWTAAELSQPLKGAPTSDNLYKNIGKKSVQVDKHTLLSRGRESADNRDTEQNATKAKSHISYCHPEEY